ncbi:RNA dependent RNA polymerase-domain-containing protein [Cytidiella melzeri]|nr:RNA dependent RNA polymerase-domain-containing protein [Cytidiella melzeri]
MEDPRESELPWLAEGPSQTDSEGIYWNELGAGNSQDPHFWDAVDAVSGTAGEKKSDLVGPLTDAHADGTEATTASGGSGRSGKRKRSASQDADARRPPIRAKDKGKGKPISLGSDDEKALWLEFPSSQFPGPTATQVSFNFSGAGSRETSMTSMSSSSSVRPKPSEEPSPEERPKVVAPPSDSRATDPPRSTSPHNSPRIMLPIARAPPRTLVPDSSDIGIVTIAHNIGKQYLMDHMKIAWGTQYEIARGVCDGRWTWQDVTVHKLHQLIGDNQDAAHRVSSVFINTSSPTQGDTDRRLWEELDREQAAIIENTDRGLGLQGEWRGQANWYGGKIQQTVNMEYTPASHSFSLKLERMQMTRSHRFARFLGSRRILQIKLTGHQRDVVRERDFLTRKFVLCGRVFVAFSTKEEKVYLMEINEDYEREPLDIQGDQHRRSLEEFVQWHNPIEMNEQQPVAKWTTRFDLGLSTSIPALRFEPDNVYIIEDICADHDGDKIPVEKVFTDGCGYMNKAALTAIAQNMGYSMVPTAIQGRLFGAKGLWMLHPHDHVQDAPQKVWIRESQLKIKLVKKFPSSDLTKLHPVHFILDLVAPPKVNVGTRLSRLIIVNLAHNGVRLSTLVNLMKDGLDREIGPLTQWQGPYAMLLLLKAVDQTTGAYVTRLQQLASGAQRALGYSRRREVNEDFDDAAVVCQSGKPLSIAEEIFDLLRAGFRPTNEQYLFDRLRVVISNVIHESVKRFHIPVLNSADAFIVPDPLGVLREGEIHFASSQVLQDPFESLDPKIITGDVLIYRNPARLPSDIRKVKAVECEALRAYTDVIVLPTTGTCSLASLLAGGDVDGDVAVCIWDHDIVSSFTNAPVVPTPTTIIEENFESAIEVVSSVRNEIRLSPDQAPKILQRCLLSGLVESRVGIYSKFHDNVIYCSGFDHPDAIRMAHMFNTLLDSRKTGRVVKASVFLQDKLKYLRDPPHCIADTDSPKYESRNPNVLKRADGLPTFILDDLLAAGVKIRDTHMSKYDGHREVFHRYPRDPNILKPYKRLAKVPTLTEETQAVADFVRTCYDRWRGFWSTSPQKLDESKANQRKKQLDAKLRALIQDYSHGPPTEKTQILRVTDALKAATASYAYSLSTTFAFNVAFRDLNDIKAKSIGASPATAEMAACMTIPSAYARVLAH